MIFDVAHLIWYTSQFMVLDPGDMINTGTPQGVGHGKKPPRYLNNGDVVELGISGLGEQKLTVAPYFATFYLMACSAPISAYTQLLPLPPASAV